MAGAGSRFGGIFKPFIKIDEKTFIEHTIESFKNFKNLIDCYYFIILQEQELEFNVSEQLNNMFPNINKKIIYLKDKTNGSAETLRQALIISDVKNNIISCDCDHYLTLDDYMYIIENKDPDVLLPMWEIDNVKNWSVVTLLNGKVIDISEKSIPATQGDIYGVIGCYYLKDVEHFLNTFNNYINISDYIKTILHKNILGVFCEEAHFYGDPERLKNFKNFLQKTSI